MQSKYSRDKYLAQQVVSLANEAKSGDVLAAEKILHRAMVALSYVIEGKSSDQEGIEALRFVHDAFRLALVDGVPLDRALCVEKSQGRKRKDNLGEIVWIVMKMDEAIDNQRASRQEVSVSQARKKVASEIGMSESHVRKAWENCGATKGYQQRKSS